MSGPIPPNPDVPVTVKTPDTYLWISTAPVTTGSPQPDNLFILSPYIHQQAAMCGSPYGLTAGTELPNDVKQWTSVNGVNQGFSRRSRAARRFAASLQSQPIGLNMYVGAVTEPTGTGFAGFANGLLAFAGTAVGSGQISIFLDGYQHLVGVSNGDTAANVASTCLTAMGGVGGGTQPQQPDCDLVPGPIIGTATVPFIATNRGEQGNSRPVVVVIPPELTGITCSPGTITVTTTSAGASGSPSLFTLRCGSQSLTVSIPVTTTVTNAATAITAAINAATFPLTATSSAGVITLFYRNGWVVQRIQMNSTEDAGGQTYTLADRHDGGQPLITCAGTATGTTLHLSAGGQTVNITITGANTAAQSATAIQSAVNGASGFPLSANAPVGGAVQLVWASGFVPSTVTLTGTDATQTYTLTFVPIIQTAATTAGSTTYTGLAGSGVPTLTTVLANRVKVAVMKEWFCEYLDSTSLTAIYAHLTTTYANGYYQENEHLTMASDEVLDASGTGVQNAKTRLTAPTPALTNDWRYDEITCQDSISPAGAIGASLAADLCATSLPFNFDGHVITQGIAVPIFGPRPDTDLDPNTTDVAMRSYFLTVAHNVNGQVQIVRGVTSWGQADTNNEAWADFSYGRMFDQARYELRQYLNQRFNGKMLFTGTSPRVENAFTLSDVEDAVREWLSANDGIIVDGAKSLFQYVIAQVDPTDGTYIRIALRLRVPREAHVKAGTLSTAPPIAA